MEEPIMNYRLLIGYKYKTIDNKHISIENFWKLGHKIVHVITKTEETNKRSKINYDDFISFIEEDKITRIP